MADDSLHPHPHMNGPTHVTTTDLRPRRYEPEDDDPRADHEDKPSGPSAAEREVTGELVQGELAGRTIYVPPVKKWRASALHHLREGDFENWAKITLADDDWDIWTEVDPTIDEIESFFVSVNSGLGTSPGNSRASRRSSRNTRRR